MSDGLRPIVVLGAGGSVGRAIVRAAESLDVPCVAVGRGVDQRRSPDFEEELTEEILARFAALRPRAIVNAIRIRAGSAQTRMTTVFGNVVRIVEATGSELIHLGSVAEVGSFGEETVPEDVSLRPVTAYGEVKLQERKYFTEALGGRYSHARVFNVFGQPAEGNSFFNDLYLQVRQAAIEGRSELALVVDNADVSRDMLHVDVVGEVVMRYALHSDRPPVMNVCSGEAVLLDDFVRIAAASHSVGVELRSRGADVAVPYVCGSATLLEKTLPEIVGRLDPRSAMLPDR